MAIEFFIPHEVVPKQSDRSRVVFAKDKHGKLVWTKQGIPKAFIKHYQDPKVVKNAKALKSLCAPFVPPQPFDCPMRLELVVMYPWRASEPKWRKESSRPKDTAPDTEQLEKQLKDVFEAVGFVTNDSRFADVHVKKLWTDAPGVQVFMEEIEDVR